MENSLNSIVEERVELMVSPNSNNFERRTAHFINPSIAIDSIHGTQPIANFPKLPRHCLSSLPATFEPKNWPLQVNFVGWKSPQKDWQTWVHKMASLHESTWKKGGIFEAIMSSKYKIERNSNLVFGVAERWCHETQSFIFPWGEATITLEDIMILGGYCVLGSPVFTPIISKEMNETLEKLNSARKGIIKTASNKASQVSWMRKFMNSGSEIEHEAFLALWLSRFVFSSAFGLVVKSVFPIAIHLARGTRIALGPAVLARVYKDLSCLKQKIVASAQLGSNGVSVALCWSPLALVQVWVWERFSDLRPKPKPIGNGEPRLALWHDLKCNVQDVRSVLDSAQGRFKWRPYIDDAKFYGGDTSKWARFDSSLDDELMSFARCLRASELVGLDGIEQYLPHRVALQFGMDQDVPGNVPRSNDTPEIAWSDYEYSIGGGKLYIPSKLFEADVTARYSSWWKRSMLIHKEESKNVFTSFKITPKSSKPSEEDNAYSGFKIVPKNSNPSCQLQTRKENGDNPSSDLGSPLKRLKPLAQNENRKKEACNASIVARSSSMPHELHRKSPNGPAFCPEVNIEVKNETCSSSCVSKPFKVLPLSLVIQKELNNSPFPPGFLPKSSINEDKVNPTVPPAFPSKNKMVEVKDIAYGSIRKKIGGNLEKSASHPGSDSLDSDGEDQLTIAEVLFKPNNKLDNSGECQSSSCSVADNDVPRCEPIAKIGAEQATNGVSMVAAIDSNGERPSVEKSVNNIEACISRLERLVAEMKAAREVK